MKTSKAQLTNIIMLSLSTLIFIIGITFMIMGYKTLKQNYVLPTNSYKVVKDSYSQDAEDMIIASLYENQDLSKIFYVDIGAMHPLLYSNTQYFYRQGANGINIDANPNSMELFNQLRERDENLEVAISDKKETLTYYKFKNKGFNTLSEKDAKHWISKGIELDDTIELETATINEILEKYLPKNQKISFINIDIEGMDYKVLKSLDFDKYAPEIFLIEELDFVLKDITEIKNGEIYKLLKSKGYTLVARTKRTSVYMKK